MRYERRGECKRCGKCCLPEKCEHLEIKDEIATCKIFGCPERPLRCIWWPEAPPILIEGCGFYFIDIWEEDRVVGYKEV